jgi:hypothetical protein
MNEKPYVKWVFSPLEHVPDEAGINAAGFDYPVVRHYTRAWRAPRHHDGFALVRCELGASQLAKVRQDKRLTVLDWNTPVPEHITTHHQQLGTTTGMSLREMLLHLAQYHARFEPHD